MDFEEEDLKDYYHKCGTSYAQALTTPIGPAQSASVLEGTAALVAARAREAARLLPGTRRPLLGRTNGNLVCRRCLRGICELLTGLNWVIVTSCGRMEGFVSEIRSAENGEEKEKIIKYKDVRNS